MQRIKLLGKVDIEDDNGRSSRLASSARGMACLAHLIYLEVSQSREFLADLLWEASSTQQARNRLRELLYRVRKAIPLVKTERDLVYFQPDKTVFVDLLALRSELAQGEAASVEQLAAALRLYQGYFLDGFYLEDAPRFNEWLVIARERLQRQVIAAYERLCQVYAEEKDWAEGLAAAQRWLALEPLDEAAHRWQIQCLAKTGQITAALQAYETCRQLLWQELAVVPETATQALVQTLLQQQQEKTAVFQPQETVRKALASKELATPSTLPPNAFVPYLRNYDFVGREELLGNIAANFAKAEAGKQRPVVAVTGIGGMGKTQTAVEFCYRYGRFFAGGVYWLNFAEPENVLEEVARIGLERGMGLYQEADKLTLADRTARVQRAWQDPIPRLLIFDNCESESLLKRWLPVSGDCYVLLTSRRGEWARELEVVPIPLQTLPLPESVTLLRQIAPHTSEDAAEQIAETVGRLPLALHLAGSFLNRYRGISPDAYLAQLQNENLVQHPSLQGHGLTHSPTDHELSLARTYAVSFDQLDDEDGVDRIARQLLAHVICFAPGEPLPQSLLLATILPAEAPVMLLLQAEDGLARLVTLGFLRREGVEMLVMHRLVRAFTETVLGEEVTTSTSATTLVESEVLRQLTAVWEKNLHLGQLPAPLGQLRYITDRALVRRDLSAAALANHLGRHFVEVEALDQAYPYLEQALAIRQQLLGQGVETAATLVHMGLFFFRQGRYAVAQQQYEQATAIFEAVLGTEHARTALNLNNLAIVHSRQGNYERALTYYEKALAIYQQTSPEDDPALPMVLTNLGITYRRMGRYEQAREAYQQAFSWRITHLGSESLPTMSTLHSLGYLEIQVGRYELAEAHFRRVLAVRERVLGKKSTSTAMAQLNLAKIKAVKRHYVAAKTTLEAVLTVFMERLGREHFRVGEALAHLGDVCRHLGDYEQAAKHLLRAQQIHEAVGERREEMIETLLTLADYYLEVGKLPEAKSVLDENLAICAQKVPAGHPFMGQLYLRLGEWHKQQGEETRATAFFERAYGVLSPADGETPVSPTHIDFIRLQKHFDVAA